MSGNAMVDVCIGGKNVTVQKWKAEIFSQRENLKKQALFLAKHGSDGSEETMMLINQKISYLNRQIGL